MNFNEDENTQCCFGNDTNFYLVFSRALKLHTTDVSIKN